MWDFANVQKIHVFSSLVVSLANKMSARLCNIYGNTKIFMFNRSAIIVFIKLFMSTINGNEHMRPVLKSF